MSNHPVRNQLRTARTIVLKVGTNVLSNDDDSLNVDRIDSLVEQIATLRNEGRRVVLVSSGAVGAGMGVLGLKTRPKALPQLQASAATGQAKLIGFYDRALARHQSHAAQLLLTANDFKHRNRYLNVRNTLLALLDMGVVPIVNENDTVSIAGICVGDNDRLASLVAGLLEDPALLVLTVADGLLDGPPSMSESRRIPVVEALNESVLAMADDTRSRRGTGGMRSKLGAIATAVDAGIHTVIADGRRENVVIDVFAGRDVGTLFVGSDSGLPAWKRWIAHAANPAGSLFLDEGAVRAIVRDGRSLLPIGVTRIDGAFDRGDVVKLCDTEGIEVARGLTNLTMDEASERIGKTSTLIGDVIDQAFVHRNNLVISRRD